MVLIASIVGLAAAVAQGTDPVTMTANGYLECTMPEESAKTCVSMASYRMLSDGSIISDDQLLLNVQPPVVLRTQSKVIRKGAQICATMTDKILADATLTIAGEPADAENARSWKQTIRERVGSLFGLEMCATYSGQTKYVTTISSVGGRAARSQPITMRWVRKSEGYSLFNKAEEALVESAGEATPLDLSPASP